MPTVLACDPQKEFYCKPRMQCLPNSWICDGTVDCQDRTDEPNTCPTANGMGFDLYDRLIYVTLYKY